ncbi:hypothetical protein Efla_002888 [Eimeria flavescens]
MVRKISVAWRLCCDYPEIDKHALVPQQPLPLTVDILSSSEGKQYFFFLICAAALYQGKIPEGKRPKTSFVTPACQRQYRRLPFENNPVALLSSSEWSTRCWREIYYRKLIINVTLTTALLFTAATLKRDIEWMDECAGARHSLGSWSSELVLGHADHSKPFFVDCDGSADGAALLQQYERALNTSSPTPPAPSSITRRTGQPGTRKQQQSCGPWKPFAHTSRASKFPGAPMTRFLSTSIARRQQKPVDCSSRAPLLASPDEPPIVLDEFPDRTVLHVRSPPAPLLLLQHLCFAVHRQALRSDVEARLVRRRHRQAPPFRSPAAASSTPASPPSHPSASPHTHPCRARSLPFPTLMTRVSQHTRSRRKRSPSPLLLANLKEGASSRFLHLSNMVICSSVVLRRVCRRHAIHGQHLRYYKTILALPKGVPGLPLAIGGSASAKTFVGSCAPVPFVLRYRTTLLSGSVAQNTHWNPLWNSRYGSLRRATAEQGNNNRIAVFLDHHTRWVELVGLPNPTAALVAEAFLITWTSLSRVPRALLSDKGPEFVAELLKQLCSTVGINKLFAAAYHPRGHSIVKSYIRSLNWTLRLCLHSFRRDWDAVLPAGAPVYRPRVPKFSPYFLVTTQKISLLLCRAWNEPALWWCRLPVLPAHQRIEDKDRKFLQDDPRRLTESMRVALLLMPKER